MGKIHRTIDLFKRAYDGEIFKNRFRNVKTGEIIEQGSQKLNKEQFFINSSDGTVNNIFNTVDKCCDFVSSMHVLLMQEWEQVEEPVTFMEAVKALNTGKTIYCQYTRSYIDTDINKGDALIVNIYKPNITNELRNEKGKPPILWMILNADWYIKEDD